MTHTLKQWKPRKDRSLHPKIGKIVVNRQRTYYGFLSRKGKILPILFSKDLDTGLTRAYASLNWQAGQMEIRLKHIRIM